MRNKLLPTVCIAVALGCGVSKDEFAAQQRDAQQNLQKYQQEAEKTAALEKALAYQQEQNTTLKQQPSEVTAASAKLQQEKGALGGNGAQDQQLASTLQTQIA